MPRRVLAESARLRAGGAQQGQRPRQCCGHDRRRQDQGGGRPQSGAAGGLHPATANHHRHHRRARQGEAGSEDPRRDEGNSRCRASAKRVRRREFLLRACQRAPDARPWRRGACGRQHGAALAQGNPKLTARLRQFIGIVKMSQGDPAGALQSYQDVNRLANAQHFVGWIINSSWNVIQSSIAIGDVQRAEGYLRQMTAAVTEGRTSGHPNMRDSYRLKGRSWEADFEAARAAVFEAKGQFHDAELSYRRAADYKRASIADSAKWDDEDRPPPDQLAHAADLDLLNAARMKAKQ